MIISNQVQNLLKIYGKQLKSEPVQPKKEVAATRRVTDEVKISGEGKLLQKAILAAKQAPDMNADKIESLKEAVVSGQYAVQDTDVAEKMIKQFLEEKMI
ncbi:MAG: flagellar biosynthesis anti-sigma factor FlgM [Solirubrobacterales bacterium]